jgi:hypothetical protein
MAKKSSYKRHRMRRGGSEYSSNLSDVVNLPSYGGRRRRVHRMRGGNGSAPYSSASTYGSYVNGSQDSQYARVFSQSGAYGSVPGNISIGAQGQNINMSGTPNANSLSLIQRAGSRRRHKKIRNTKKRRGGFLGQVLNQAVVPFGLLGMQQSYKRRQSNNTFKSRRRYK